VRAGEERGAFFLTPPHKHTHYTLSSFLLRTQEAHQNGTAAVIVCGQPDAERYCEGLRGNGLVASIEPASGGKGEGGGGDPA
jgi:hypothetical protein